MKNTLETVFNGTEPHQPSEEKRKCSHCKEEKPYSSFSKQSKVKSGIRTICKACEKVYRDTHSPNTESKRESGRRPEAKLKKKERYIRDLNNPKRKEQVLRAVNKYRDANKVKTKAHDMIKEALRKGEMTKSICVVCGDKDTHGHHPDYSKPLEVVWLCQRHHRDYHVVERECSKIVNFASREALVASQAEKKVLNYINCEHCIDYLKDNER